MRRGHGSLATAPGARSAREKVEAICEAGNGVVGGGFGGVFHMICKDFQNCSKRGVGANADVLSESTEMAKHARACPQCGGFVRGEHLLKKQLDSLRAAMPQVPPSLDAAVVRNYRRHLAERPVAID